jgi:shikimate kinase
MTARGIYLIGFSGTGKSTVARLVADGLGCAAHDIDALIVAQCGMDIPTIFAREGEPGFRDRETAALRELATTCWPIADDELPSMAQFLTPFVAATGGGLPLRAENRALMERTGWVVALEGRPETLYARLERQRALADPDAVRPLLDGDDALARMCALKERRQSIYALADWTVHTDRLTPVQVAAEIMRAVVILAQSGA